MKSNYWDKKAITYDNHLKKSEKAYLQIVELIRSEINKTQLILDIGTGTGEIPIAIADKSGKIIATDYSREMILVCEEKIQRSGINNVSFQVQDCYDLEYGDRTIDVIVVSNLLHLVDKPEQFLISLKRLLKKDGKLIIATYLHNECMKSKILSRILKLTGHPVKSRFDSNSLGELITDCGYKIDKRVFISNIMPMLFAVATK